MLRCDENTQKSNSNEPHTIDRSLQHRSVSVIFINYHPLPARAPAPVQQQQQQQQQQPPFTMKLSLACLQRRMCGSVTSSFLYLLVLLALLTRLQPFLSSLLVVPKDPHHNLRDKLLFPRGVARPDDLDGAKVKIGEGRSHGDEKLWFNAPNCSVMDFMGGPDPTAKMAYDSSLICGEKAVDRDVICSLFFAQIGLRDDGDCIRKTDDHKVPKIVYFVIFGDYTFRFWHYVSIMAAKRHVSPTALYIIGDAHPMGYWWKRVMRDCKGIRFLYRSRPTEIGGQPVKFKHHLSDLVRLQALLLNGGIYLDADMVVTRPLDPLLDHDITMGLIENGTGMGNAFIAAKRNSPFVREWYDNYNTYNNTKFYTNSLHVPRDMWHKNPGRLHMESDRLYRPNWFEADKLFKRWDYDWSQNYAVHVWTNGNPVPKSEEEIQTANTTIAQVFRNALYGDPRPRHQSMLGNSVNGKEII